MQELVTFFIENGKSIIAIAGVAAIAYHHVTKELTLVYDWFAANGSYKGVWRNFSTGLPDKSVNDNSQKTDSK